MATTFLKVKNRAVSTLASAIVAGDLALDVKAGEGTKFPNAFPFHITIQDEILVCTNRVTDTLTVTRAAQGTVASSHAKSAVVSLNITAQNISDLNTAVNTLEGYCPSAAVLKTLFDAGTVLYATADDTPQAKTRAQLIALLSGQAGGAFSWNSQELTNAKLNALVLKGTFTADGVVTMPPFTLGGTITLNGQVFDAGAGQAQINTTGITVLTLQSTQDSANGAQIRVATISASPAGGDIVGDFIFDGKDSGGNDFVYGIQRCSISDPTDTVETGQMLWYIAAAGSLNAALVLTGAGVLAPDHSLMLGQSQDLALTADQVSLGGYEIGAGNRVLCLAQETAVAVEVDETKFSHKMQVRINGATYYMMLTAT